MAAVATRETKMKKKGKFVENPDFHEYEIRLTQRLQSNNEVQRRQALKEVDKWLKIRLDSEAGPIRPEAFVLWKGLFYALWMSDKPLVQEQMAQRISSFMDLTSPFKSLQFFKYGLDILCHEWFGIDQLRLDKFLMFARRFLRTGLAVVKNSKYKRKVISQFNSVLSATVLNKELITRSNCMGLTLHVVEVFLEELAKVSEGRLPLNVVPAFLKPFVEFFAKSDDERLTKCVKKNVFQYLLEQSDAGQEHEEKFRAWSELGYPGGDINLMKKVDMSDDEETNGEVFENGSEEKPLDPRAGRVDVILPEIRFRAKDVAELVRGYRFAEGTTVRSRKAINSVVSLFEKMAQGDYPLGVKKVDLPRKDNRSKRIKQAVNRLVKFEKKIKPNLKRKLKEDVEEKTTPKPKKIKLASKGTTESTNKSAKKSITTPVKTPPKKSKPKQSKEPDFDYSFERPSGTWFVSELDSPKGDEKSPVFSESKWEPENAGTPKVIIQSDIILRKPFVRRSFPVEAKKVKIDLKLNRSQEIHEHVKQVRSSPGIPFDADRKPVKPLLKRRFSTPIDPFYKVPR